MFVAQAESSTHPPASNALGEIHPRIVPLPPTSKTWSGARPGSTPSNVENRPATSRSSFRVPGSPSSFVPTQRRTMKRACIIVLVAWSLTVLGCGDDEGSPVPPDRDGGSTTVAPDAAPADAAWPGPATRSCRTARPASSARGGAPSPASWPSNLPAHFRRPGPRPQTVRTAASGVRPAMTATSCRLPMGNPLRLPQILQYERRLLERDLRRRRPRLRGRLQEPHRPPLHPVMSSGARAVSPFRHIPHRTVLREFTE